MLEKLASARGTLFIFVFFGSLWYVLTRFLPDNSLRSILTIGFAFPFCAIFMWSLFRTLQRIYGGYGNLWSEIALTALNVFLFLLVFSAIYYEVGIVDTTIDGNPISQSFWNCAYYSVITFTSTGYGDFRPQGIARALASLHTFIGYLVLGLMASTLMSVVQWKTEGTGVDRGGSNS